MASDPTRAPAAPQYDTVYEEYDLETGRVAAIADPANDEAWIRSDLTTPLEN